MLARVEGRIGTTLRGKYRLDRLLGVGAMAAVYAATHRNGMRVAIKLLHPEMSQTADIRRRFVREGAIANRVNHPGVVRIVDDDVDDADHAFLVMELLEGRTLDAEWEASGGKLAPERVGALVLQLLDVLVAIHGEGIIHRDIKPDNVFLTTDGALKVLDLGIARVLESRTVTKVGVLMGTPGFVAPEQALGDAHRIDARTDLFSVGAMMFALLTGEVIHPGETGMAQMVLAASEQARSVLAVSPEVPPALANVVDVALSFEKTKRWESAAQMKTALEHSLPVRPKAVRVEPDPTVPFLLRRKP
jgi:serine/threonine-protein kinase